MRVFLAWLLGSRQRQVGTAALTATAVAGPTLASTLPAPTGFAPATLPPAVLAPPVFAPVQITSTRVLSTRVLLVAHDRRFRAVASALLSQRGYTVLVCRRDEDVAQLAVHDGIDVVLIDASASLTAAAREAARLESLCPPVGIVAVSEDAHPPGLATLPVFPKWTAFDDVFGAIDRAGEHSIRDGVISEAF